MKDMLLPQATYSCHHQICNGIISESNLTRRRLVASSTHIDEHYLASRNFDYQVFWAKGRIGCNLGINSHFNCTTITVEDHEFQAISMKRMITTRVSRIKRNGRGRFPAMSFNQRHIAPLSEKVASGLFAVDADDALSFDNLGSKRMPKLDSKSVIGEGSFRRMLAHIRQLGVGLRTTLEALEESYFEPIHHVVVSNPILTHHTSPH